ncbi:phospholipase domain-containing protein, partial [Acinetobacter baumannii]
EKGIRRRRPTPYVLDAQVRLAGATRELVFANRSRLRAAVFHVYDVRHPETGPARYTVGAGAELAHPVAGADGTVDLFVLGPNGFHRRLTSGT